MRAQKDRRRYIVDLSRDDDPVIKFANPGHVDNEYHQFDKISDVGLYLIGEGFRDGDIKTCVSDARNFPHRWVKLKKVE